MNGHTPPPPLASLPSQRSVLPVIVEQNAAHVEAVTPLNVNKLVTLRFVLVAFVDKRVALVNLERLVEVVATMRPSLSVDRTPFVMPVSHALPEKLASVVEALLKICSALHVFRSARAVDDAAATVIDEPRLKPAPLIVPKEPEIKPEPMVVVETTRPLLSVERSADVNDVNHVPPVLVNCVVVARVALKSPTTVEDACDTKPEVNVARLETPSVDESVVAPVTPSVPANEPLPPANVPTDATLVYRFVELAVVAKNEVDVACVSVTFPENVLAPLQLLMSARSVLDAAVIVMEFPRAKFVPFIVPNDPDISPDPIEVVATTEPSTLVERRALARLVIAKDVEVACVSVALPLKVFTPVQVLVFARRVEDAAVTVTLDPRAKSVPLIVPNEPLIKPEPIVVVEVRRPF